MKKVLYVIVGLVVVYLIMCMVGPKESVIERTTVVNQKPEVVKAQLVDFKFMNEKWSPWTPKDPNIKLTYSGEVGKPGYKYDWDGNPDSVGAGSMEYLRVNGDSIVQKLMFKGWDAISYTYLIVVPEGEGSKITWKMAMPMDFIWRGFGLFMNAEKQMGRDFNNGIANMKTALEALEPTANYEIKELEWPEVTYIGSKTEVVEFMKFGDYYGKHLPAIMEQMEKSKVTPESAPSGLYNGEFNMAEMKAPVAAVFKVANGTKLKGYEAYVLPACKVVHVAYFGDYMKMHNAYETMDKYIAEKGLTRSRMIEEYVTDPMVETDTAKWHTNIYYLVK